MVEGFDRRRLLTAWLLGSRERLEESWDKK
jgi:hypothetical protein